MDKITSEMVPEEAVNAFIEALVQTPMLTMAGCIAAAINAWPEMEFSKHLSVRDDGEGYCLKRTGIHLPLPPQEKTND